MAEGALRPLAIWGASGHAKVLAEFAVDAGFRLVAFFDNSPQVGSPVPGVPIHHGSDGFLRWRAACAEQAVWGTVAIGGLRGLDRIELLGLFGANRVNAATMVHPRAFVARTATVGDGSQVLAHASVCADASIGNACIVNTNASVDHECRLADGIHIAPAASIAGCVEIGSCAFVGIGAVVLPRLRIGAGAIVGAGAVVTRDVPDHAVVYGNPARIVRQTEV
jgi:sugar O-acyltransferase (sialic acid O-acetyltransferase NeuD family)